MLAGYRTLILCLVALCFGPALSAESELMILAPRSPHPRMLYGIEKLSLGLQGAGIRPIVTTTESIPPDHRFILIAESPSDLRLKQLLSKDVDRLRGDESYLLRSISAGNGLVIAGGGTSGALYGCLDLAERLKPARKLPTEIDLVEHPTMKLRGTCLLLLKWGYGYDYPITPAALPWFFDKKLMLEYLDFLANSRFNTVFFWNGHPFPYLLHLSRYPEARVLSQNELESNIEYFRWLTAEADRRGIRTVLQFYNIHVPAPFAEAHKQDGVQLANPRATPLLKEYTRYAIREFVRQYPNVGLLVCAGEALREEREEWVRDVILDAVKDTGKNPPVIVREWNITPDRYKNIIAPSYPNLLTMMKHNVEMIVSPRPDPRNKTWVELGHGHVINLHMLADVQPFRWGSPSFIREMIQHWVEIGASGAHIYPQVTFNWPLALDRTGAPLRELDRDWLYFEALGRYLWNPFRDEKQEAHHWLDRLADYHGSTAAAEHALRYYEISGPLLPTIQNLLSIVNMGMFPTSVGHIVTLDAILKAIRVQGADTVLARPLDTKTAAQYFGGDSSRSASQMSTTPISVRDYVESVVSGKLSKDRIEPLPLLKLLADNANRAMKEAEGVSRLADRNTMEAGRLLLDARALDLLVTFYKFKVSAAIHKGLYDRLGEDSYADQFLTDLADSVVSYSKLVELTNRTYRQAVDLGDWLNWQYALEGFERELAFYREQAAHARNGADILVLGVNGPFEDVDNAFYWSLNREAKSRKLRLSSYMIRPAMIRGARLIVAFDLNDSMFTEHVQELRRWLRGGGHLLIWDERARFHNVPGLLPSDLTIAGPSDSTADNANVAIRFAKTNHPLLRGFSGATIRKTWPTALPTSIHSFFGEWQPLASTYAMTNDTPIFGLDEYQPFGPRWVGIPGFVERPLILESQVGQGRIALMQLGRWLGAYPAPPKTLAAVDDQVMSKGVTQAVDFCRLLVSNILDWSL
jgi:hypothetical protein